MIGLLLVLFAAGQVLALVLQAATIAWLAWTCVRLIAALARRV